MNDTPTLEELLEAVAVTLSEQVVPETSGPTRHAVRVAANLCRIAAREHAAQTGEETDHAIAALLGDDSVTTAAHVGDLARRLDERLQSDDPDFEASVADLLYVDVCRRVDIAKPGYREVTE